MFKPFFTFISCGKYSTQRLGHNCVLQLICKPLRRNILPIYAPIIGSVVPTIGNTTSYLWNANSAVYISVHNLLLKTKNCFSVVCGTYVDSYTTQIYFYPNINIIHESPNKIKLKICSPYPFTL